MAVNKQSSTETEADIKITNGDWQALKAIANSYGLTDEADVITFAIGVLSQADGKPVSIERGDGSVLKLIPSDKLRKTT